MNCSWVSSVDVSLIGPKSCHLKLEIVFQNNDDPKVRTDPDTKGVSEITLSYTFYPVEKPEAAR